MSEIWIDIIAAIGASGVAGALVSWWKDRDKDDVEVTKMLRQMSKEAVADARTELAGLKADMREVRSIIEEFVRVVECDVLPAIPVEQTEPRRHLRAIASRAKAVV